LNQLKDDDQLTLATHLMAPNELFFPLTELSYPDIIKAYLKHYSPGIKAVLSAFLEGETLVPSLDDLKLCLDPEGLNKLGHSIRITHLETFYPPIMELCKQIYKQQNILLTCGIYITPNENSQCFLYHCDHQHILAYQLAGEKLWSFPKRAGEFVREYTIKPALNTLINEQRIQFETTDITLKTGELLFVPYAYSHRAHNQATKPSAHLTFAEDDVTIRDFVSFVALEVLGVTNFEGRFYEKLNQEDFDQRLSVFNPQSAKGHALHFFTKTKMLKFKFGSNSKL
jgi:hypothetical protein